MTTEAAHRDATVFPTLEIRCEACDGKGGWAEDGYRYECQDCDGTGFVLTSFGREIMEFVRHAAARLQRQA